MRRPSWRPREGERRAADRGPYGRARTAGRLSAADERSADNRSRRRPCRPPPLGPRCAGDRGAAKCGLRRGCRSLPRPDDAALDCRQARCVGARQRHDGRGSLHAREVRVHTTTLETIRFQRPDRIECRLVRGPVPSGARRFPPRGAPQPGVAPGRSAAGPPPLRVIHNPRRPCRRPAGAAGRQPAANVCVRSTSG
jgi:hypothetical protein